MACFLIFAAAALCAGFFLDLVVGDPKGWPHLVRGMGALIGRLERTLYPLPNNITPEPKYRMSCRSFHRSALLPKALHTTSMRGFGNAHIGENPQHVDPIFRSRCNRKRGMCLVIFTLLICTALPVLLLFLAFRISPWLYFALETILCWQVLSVKSLRAESGAVADELRRGDLNAARTALSMIVGRDTAELDEAGITRAAVETVAENTSDGVVAPLFYLMLGGAPLGCLYKAANTMDSMVAYKNERYLDFGRCAAKTDDILNFIPSRLGAILMIAAAWFCRMDAKNAAAVWRRDRRKHASPNSAQTEAVMAGALRIRLAGDATYFGKKQEKPYIGDDLRPIETEDIRRSHRLLYATAALMFLVCAAERIVLYAAV